MRHGSYVSVRRQEFYTRNMIYRDDLFEVLDNLLATGPKTAVHAQQSALLDDSTTRQPRSRGLQMVEL